MINKNNLQVVALAACLGAGAGAQAGPLVGIDLDGNANTFEAYYDTALNISWLANAGALSGLRTWADAMAWAAGLNVHGVTGWRLPTTANPDPSCAVQAGYFVGGSNCTGSEMGHLANVDGVGTANPLGFSNVAGDWLWSSTRFVAQDPEGAYVFRFDNKTQSGDWADAAPRYGVNTPAFHSAWAVHDGNVGALTTTVPEPASWALVALGLVAAAGVAGRRQR